MTIESHCNDAEDNGMYAVTEGTVYEIDMGASQSFVQLKYKGASSSGDVVSPMNVALLLVSATNESH